MSGRFLRYPDHRCARPILRAGAIWQCDECGQIWAVSEWTGDLKRISERRARRLIVRRGE